MKARSAGVWASHCLLLGRRGSGICPVAGGRLTRSDPQSDGPALSFYGLFKGFPKAPFLSYRDWNTCPSPLAW